MNAPGPGLCLLYRCHVPGTYNQFLLTGNFQQVTAEGMKEGRDSTTWDVTKHLLQERQGQSFRLKSSTASLPVPITHSFTQQLRTRGHAVPRSAPGKHNSPCGGDILCSATAPTAMSSTQGGRVPDSTQQ